MVEMDFAINQVTETLQVFSAKSSSDRLIFWKIDFVELSFCFVPQYDHHKILLFML